MLIPVRLYTILISQVVSLSDEFVWRKRYRILLIPDVMRIPTIRYYVGSLSDYVLSGG
jgi:hypothetical protein